jgi:K+-sensing histidine kinase KdpD
MPAPKKATNSKAKKENTSPKEELNHGEDTDELGQSLASSVQNVLAIVKKDVENIPPAVVELLIALAKHVASLKWAVKLLEGRQQLRDSLATTQTENLTAVLEDLAVSLRKMSETDWGMKRSDHAIFQGGINIELGKISNAIEAVQSWYAVQTDPSFIFEREVLERVPLNEIVSSVIAEIEGENERARIVPIIPEDLYVSTSRQRLELILAAIIDNALRFSDGKEVDILAGLNEDLELWIEINDRGPGLKGVDPEELWKDLSHRMSEQDKTGRADGLSLGLYLAKMMVDSLNGALELVDRPGGGMSARIFLPQRREGDIT